MNALIRKIVQTLGVKWLTGKIRDAAEGRLGQTWKTVYWELAGNKRYLSFVLGLVAGSALLLDYPKIAEVCGALAAIGISLGFVDANWRSVQEEEDWLKDSWLWKFLAANSPTLTTLLGLALAWFQSGACMFGVWCARDALIVTVVGAVLVQVGLVDAAWKARPPVRG